MKILILLLLLSVTQISFADWEKCNINNVDSNIQALTIKDKIIFAGTANSGILRSTDNGDSWETVNKGLQLQSVYGITAIDTLLFTSTGYGVFCSSDMGRSWRSKKNGMELIGLSLVAIGATLYGVSTSPRGLLMRSIDKGESWTSMDQYCSVSYLYDHKIVAKDTTLFIVTNSGLIRSADNGDSWAPVTLNISNVKVVYDLMLCGTALFATISDSLQSMVIRSTDNGESWVKVRTGINKDDRYGLSENRGVLFATSRKETYRSTDNGNNWEVITPYSLKIGYRALTNIGSILFAATRDEIYKSMDNGLSWSSLYSGIYAQNISSLVAFDSVLYLATSNGIRRSTDFGIIWANASTGLTNAYLPPIVSLAVKDTSIFAFTDRGVIFRSTDNGENWIFANKGLRKDDGREPTEIIAIGVKDSIVYIRARYFNIATEEARDFKSTNNGENWISAKILTVPSFTDKSKTFAFGSWYVGVGHGTDSGDNWLEFKSTYKLIDTSVYTVVTTNTSAFAGTNGKGIYRSTDFGETWKQVNKGLTNLDIRSFAVNDTIIFAGTEGGGVYGSTDNGNTWIPKNTKLMTTTVQSLTISDNTLFAGTSGEGIFRCKLTDFATDVDESSTPNTSFQIFPQPSNDYLRIRGVKKSLHSSDNFIRIYNLLGESVKSEPIAGISQMQIDISSLASGVYYLKIGAETKMLVKQ